MSVTGAPTRPGYGRRYRSAYRRIWPVAFLILIALSLLSAITGQSETVRQILTERAELAIIDLFFYFVLVPALLAALLAAVISLFAAIRSRG